MEHPSGPLLAHRLYDGGLTRSLTQLIDDKINVLMRGTFMIMICLIIVTLHHPAPPSPKCTQTHTHKGYLIPFPNKVGEHECIINKLCYQNTSALTPPYTILPVDRNKHADTHTNVI